MKLHIVVLLCFLTSALAAQTAAGGRPSPKDVDSKEIRLGEDEPGCKDSLLMPRIAGCSIIQCDSKDMATLDIQVGSSTEGVAQKESMDGASEVIYYLCPAKVSLSSIIKNSDAALVKAGFKVAFNGKDDEEQPLVTAFKDTQWVQVSTYMYNEYSAYILTAVKVDGDAQVTSDALAEEMSKGGRVTLAGLQFAKDKVDVPVETEKVLVEIAALLVRQPQWKIRVEATGSEAAAAQERASLVAGWLLDHGIDKTRVSIQGLAQVDTPPRVDLVRFDSLLTPR